jgi:hypothetical protein
MQTFTDMLPFLIPVFIIEVALIVIALLDLFKREGMNSTTRLIWVFVIVLINLFGPLVYLFFGRKDKPIDGD